MTQSDEIYADDNDNGGARAIADVKTGEYGDVCEKSLSQIYFCIVSNKLFFFFFLPFVRVCLNTGY